MRTQDIPFRFIFCLMNIYHGVFHCLKLARRNGRNDTRRAVRQMILTACNYVIHFAIHKCVTACSVRVHIDKACTYVFARKIIALFASFFGRAYAYDFSILYVHVPVE